MMHHYEKGEEQKHVVFIHTYIRTYVLVAVHLSMLALLCTYVRRYVRTYVCMHIHAQVLTRKYVLVQLLLLRTCVSKRNLQIWTL